MSGEDWMIIRWEEGCLTLANPFFLTRYLPGLFLMSPYCEASWTAKLELSLAEGRSSIYREKSMNVWRVKFLCKWPPSTRTFALSPQMQIWEYPCARLTCRSALNPVGSLEHSCSLDHGLDTALTILVQLSFSLCHKTFEHVCRCGKYSLDMQLSFCRCWKPGLFVNEVLRTADQTMCNMRLFCLVSHERSDRILAVLL